MSDLSYRFGAFCTRVAMTLTTRKHVSGLEHIPHEGACLIMANHISHFDPNVLGMSTPLRGRCIDYMADLPLLKLPVIGPILKSWNAFPIDRTKLIDRASIRTAIERLNAGRMVGIFPERGLRYGDKSILGGAELAVGSAALWQMAKVPLVPAVLFGSDQLYQWRNLFRRPLLVVKYGPVLPPPDEDETREQARDRIVAAIRALYAEVLAEHSPRPHEFPRDPKERFSERWCNSSCKPQEVGVE